MSEELKTQEKIKEAARGLFIEKGFSATKTRDIADKSGINLALLNYYFKSKAKLFELIMFETFTEFLQGMMATLNDPKTTLEQKIELFVISYINLLIAQPGLPHFIMGEIKNNPPQLLNIVQGKNEMMKSAFFHQLRERAGHSSAKPIHPLHFLMNIMSMTVFPFIAKPMIKGVSKMSDREFDQLMEQRKALIPLWINLLLDHHYKA